jgi:purine-nucleoside phosphorylase
MNTEMREELAEAVELLRDNFVGLVAPVAIVTGSGLGALAELGSELADVPFSAVPGLGASTIAGHSGRWALLDAGPCRVFCLMGRRHVYEGIDPALSGYTMRLLAALGTKVVILTNAAGGLARRFYPGDLMLLTDHINLMFRNPLLGRHEAQDGPRFPDMSAPYDAGVSAALREAARAEQVDLKDGTYLALTGPTYETRAEVTAWQRIGADAVGMSTIPEVLVANQAGLRVAAISLITNSHVHPAPPPTHEEVLEMGRHAGDRLKRVIAGALARLAPEFNA